MANKALLIIKRYSNVGQMETSTYGAKRKQISDQLQKIVDLRFVPDRYKVDNESGEDHEIENTQHHHFPIQQAITNITHHGCGDIEEHEPAQKRTGRMEQKSDSKPS